MPRILSELKDSAAFDERKAAVDRFNTANRWKKRGIALSPMRYGLGHGHVAGSNVTINVHAADGSIEVFHTGQEMGQGLTTKLQLAIACKLNVPVENIYVHGTNTSVIPNDVVTGGSTTSEATCRAAELACEELLGRLAPIEKTINDGKAAEAKDKGEAATSASWGEICAAAWGGGGGTETLSVNRKYSAKDSKIDVAGYFGLGAAVTEVRLLD